MQKKNIMTLFVLCLFQVAMLVYSAVLPGQLEDAIQGSNADTPHVQSLTRAYAIVIPAVVGACSMCMTAMLWPLYHECVDPSRAALSFPSARASRLTRSSSSSWSQVRLERLVRLPLPRHERPRASTLTPLEPLLPPQQAHRRRPRDPPHVPPVPDLRLPPQVRRLLPHRVQHPVLDPRVGHADGRVWCVRDVLFVLAVSLGAVLTSLPLVAVLTIIALPISLLALVLFAVRRALTSRPTELLTLTRTRERAGRRACREPARRLLLVLPPSGWHGCVEPAHPLLHRALGPLDLELTAAPPRPRRSLAAYFAYKISRIYNDTSSDRYSAARATLTIFSVLCLVMLLATFVLMGLCMLNFDKGLKERSASIFLFSLSLSPRLARS